MAVADPSASTAPAGSTASRSHRGESSAGAGDVLDSIGKHIPLPIEVPDWSRPIILVLALLAIAFGLRAAVSGARARRLERQRTMLMRDLDTMQAALVPAVPARLGGLALSVAYRPADGPAAGGDFYDVFMTHENKVAIILGDVSGHGHEALNHAALTRYTLRAYMQAGLSPRAALALAGRALADPQIDHYATVMVATFDERESLLTYASAGHPPPIIHGLPMHGPLASCSSPPVGWNVPTGRRQTTVALPAGAVVCFFSDGLIEARCGSDLLGSERLSEMLADIGREPDATRLLEHVRGAATSTPDDMAACVIASEAGADPSAVHVEEVEVDAKFLAGKCVSRFLESCRVPPLARTRAIARARTLAGAAGTAVLRVQLGATSATVTVTAGEENASAPSTQRRPSGVERQLAARPLSAV